MPTSSENQTISARGFPWVAVVSTLLILILIPFLIWEDRMNTWAASVLNERASRAIVFGTVLGLLSTDIVLPVPSSVVSTAAGALLGFWGGWTASFLGMSFACAGGYGLGRYAGIKVIRRFVSEEELSGAGRKFERWGDWAIIASRPVPMLAEASAVIAGTLRRPFPRFFALCALSNLAVSAVYAAIGAFAYRTEAFIWSFVGAIGLPWVALKIAGRKRKP